MGDTDSSYVEIPESAIPGDGLIARFEDAETFYNPSLKPEGTIPANVFAIQFQIPADDYSEIDFDFDFDFCITGIKAIVE